MSRIQFAQKSILPLKCSVLNSPYPLFSPLHKDLVCILELATVIFFFFQNKADRRRAQASAWHCCNWEKHFVNNCAGISVNPLLRESAAEQLLMLWRSPTHTPGQLLLSFLQVEKVVSHSFENWGADSALYSTSPIGILLPCFTLWIQALAIYPPSAGKISWSIPEMVQGQEWVIVEGEWWTLGVKKAPRGNIAWG